MHTFNDMRFNSFPVRLKVNNENERIKKLLFQFLSGSIKRIECYGMYPYRVDGFNSFPVRLKGIRPALQ